MQSFAREMASITFRLYLTIIGMPTNQNRAGNTLRISIIHHGTLSVLLQLDRRLESRTRASMNARILEYCCFISKSSVMIQLLLIRWL